MHWVTDPSNFDDAFFRIRIRKLLEETQNGNLKQDILKVTSICQSTKHRLEQNGWKIFILALETFDL